MIATYALSPVPHERGTAVALGYFDGVHLGHREVLRAAQRTAQEKGTADAVFTFTLPTSPGAQTAPAGKGRALLTQTEKRRRMEQLGVQHYFCPPFESFCALTPEQFVDEVLVRCLGAQDVFCGDNFTFGAHKSGNVEVLRTLCAQRDIAVHVVKMAQYEGGVVSSSRIRQCLAQGDMDAVNAMLGEAYRIDLPVHHGKAFGRTMGFPTINQIYPPQLLLPKSGVYITTTCVNDQWLPSATGLGTRPTVTHSAPDAPDAGVTCETFIADYQGDLYGDTVEVRFHAYLKPTVKFDDVAALRAYINTAAQAAKEYYRENF